MKTRQFAAAITEIDGIELFGEKIDLLREGS